MTATYLGMSYLAWAWILWGGVFGTYLTIMLYRTLIGGKQDELFVPPDEMRRNRQHLRDVARIASIFGIASAVLFAVNVAVFVFVR